MRRLVLGAGSERQPAGPGGVRAHVPAHHAAIRTTAIAAAAKELADDDAFVLKNTAARDWRRALIENRPAMRELMQIYAGKAR